MDTSIHFPIFIAASLAVFWLVLRVALRRREAPSPRVRAIVSAIVVVGGMVFAKVGANLGLSWGIYYGVPAGLTLLLPPLAFGMSFIEVAEYLVLAWCSSPAMHIAFSFLLGWHEYLPFFRVPAFWEL